MARFVLLDSGPLGLLAVRNGLEPADRCRAWLETLLAGGVDVGVPDIAFYEVQRELLRRQAAVQSARLDTVAARLVRVPVTAEAWDRAAEFWAEARRAGRPTADSRALDADAVIAGVAATVAGPGPGLDVVVATTNVEHLARYVRAANWASIVV